VIVVPPRRMEVQHSRRNYTLYEFDGAMNAPTKQRHYRYSYVRIVHGNIQQPVQFVT